MKVTNSFSDKKCLVITIFVYLFFRNYRFWLYQFLFSNEAGYQWIKWQCFVGSSKAEQMQENEHSSSRSPEKSLNGMEIFPDDLVFSWTVSVKFFGTWTNRFSCFSSIKEPVVPLILPQGSKVMHKILKNLNCAEIQEIIEGHYWTSRENSGKNLVYIRGVLQVNCKRKGPNPIPLFFPLGLFLFSLFLLSYSFVFFVCPSSGPLMWQDQRRTWGLVILYVFFPCFFWAKHSDHNLLHNPHWTWLWDWEGSVKVCCVPALWVVCGG